MMRKGMLDGIEKLEFAPMFSKTLLSYLSFFSLSMP